MNSNVPMLPLHSRPGPTSKSNLSQVTRSDAAREGSASSQSSAVASGVQQTVPATVSSDTITGVTLHIHRVESHNDAIPAPPSPAAASEAVGVANLVRMLGATVRTGLGSDFTVGVMTLLGVLVAVSLGGWSIYLAQRSLSLSEWAFCKSYANDIQVLKSQKCQEYTRRTSLDDLRRSSEIVASEVPVVVSETVPFYFLVPDMIEATSCHVVCWNEISLEDQTYRGPTQVDMKRLEEEIEASYSVIRRAYKVWPLNLGSVILILGSVILILGSVILLYTDWLLRTNYGTNPILWRSRRKRNPFQIIPPFGKWTLVAIGYCMKFGPAVLLWFLLSFCYSVLRVYLVVGTPSSFRAAIWSYKMVVQLVIPYNFALLIFFDLRLLHDTRKTLSSPKSILLLPIS